MGGSTIRMRQRGAGHMKAIIAIAILFLLAYSAIKVIPHFVNDYDLRDHMDQTARFAAVGNQTEQQIRESVWKKVQELEIPATPDALKVSKGNRRVQVSLQYTVEVSLLGYPLKLNFHPEVDNKGF